MGKKISKETQGCFYQGNWDMSENCISEGLKSCMKAELRPNEFQKKIDPPSKFVKNAYL